jgi:hypothetical protein
LIEQALVISIGPNDFEGIKNLADHVLPWMFNRETLQVVGDGDFTIVTMVLMIMSFCSNTQFKREILVLPTNVLGQTWIIWINHGQILA